MGLRGQGERNSGLHTRHGLDVTHPPYDSTSLLHCLRVEVCGLDAFVGRRERIEEPGAGLGEALFLHCFDAWV